MSNSPLYRYSTLYFSIQLLMDIWVVSTFWLLQRKLLRTFVNRFLCGLMFTFLLGYIPRSRIAGSYNKSMFNFLRNCQTGSQSNCTCLYSHQLCMRVPISPHPHQQLLHLIFIKTILVGVKCCLTVVLICTPLMTTDFE